MKKQKLTKKQEAAIQARKDREFAAEYSPQRLPQSLKQDKHYLDRINSVHEDADDTINIQINKQNNGG